MSFLNLLLGPKAALPSPPPVTAGEWWPGDDWDGTANPDDAPTPQPITYATGPMEVVNLSRMETITGNTTFAVRAPDAAGIRIKGAKREAVSQETKLVEILGHLVPCFTFTVRHDLAMKIGRGHAHIYIEEIPLQPEKYQPRMLGPFDLNLRPTAYDRLIKIAVTPGFPGAEFTGNQALTNAKREVRNNPSQLIHIECIESGEYDWRDVGNPVFFATEKYVIKAAPGVEASLGGSYRNGNAYERINNYELWNIKCPVDRMSTAITNAIAIQNNGIATFRSGVEIYCTTGAGTLINNRPPGSWLARNAAVNPNAVYEFLDCDIYDLPSYGVIGSDILFGCRLRDISGTGIQNPRGYVGFLTIERISGVLVDWRTYHHALDVTYSGGGSAWIQKAGLNGAVGAFNGYLSSSSITASHSGTTLTVTAVAPGVTLGVGSYIAASAGVANGTRIIALGTGTGGTGTYITTNDSSSSQGAATEQTFSSRTCYVAVLTAPLTLTTSVPALAETINSAWPAEWSAVPDLTDNRAACYLLLDGGTPGQGLPFTSISGERALHTIIDTHTNIIASGIAMENALFEFAVVPSNVTSGLISWDDSGGAFASVWVQNVVIVDTSAQEGSAPQDGRVQGANKNVRFRNVTIVGAGMNMVGSSYSATDDCTFTNSFIDRLSFVSTTPNPNPNVVIDRVISRAALPATATNSQNLGDVALDTLFEAPASDNAFTGYRPLKSGALYVAARAAGALVASEDVTEANGGWNLSY